MPLAVRCQIHYVKARVTAALRTQPMLERMRTQRSFDPTRSAVLSKHYETGIVSIYASACHADQIVIRTVLQVLRERIRTERDSGLQQSSDLVAHAAATRLSLSAWPHPIVVELNLPTEYPTETYKAPYATFAR
jgi:hypothetical protein